MEAHWYEPRLLLEAWQRFESEETNDGPSLTVQELAEKSLARQKAEGRSARTVLDDRWRLNALAKTMGHLRAGAVKRADILRYLEGIPPGTNRRRDGDWWIGWVEEVPGVNTQERSREELLASLRLILAEALEFNRREARAAAESGFEEESFNF
jgi:hypothetical protein